MSGLPTMWDKMCNDDYPDDRYAQRGYAADDAAKGPTSSDFQMASTELEREREQISEWALREYLTLGGKSDFVKHLCSECGIDYSRVTGDPLTLNLDKDTDMKSSDLMTSKFLKQSDVPTDKLVTVKEIKKQNVARDDEDAEYKYTIYFEEFEKGMVLNATNIKRLSKALGDETDDWIGGKVVLYVDPDIEYAGQIVGGLRIRARKAAAGPAKPPRNTEDHDPDIPF